MAQRLIRLICKNCKESYDVEEDLLKQLDIKRGERNFYRGKGCKECNNTGYRGRIGVFEILAVTPKIKKLIIDRAESNVILQAARDDGMLTLYQDALQRAYQGITTIDEVLRVTYG